MCGIAGMIGLGDTYPADEAVLVRMRDTMVHRGPDGGGCYVSPDRRVGLAHRRLSIVDLSDSAAQPMPNEDGDIWVSFNGEIYNHAELRLDLLAAGHRFRTDHSDTEVLLHGYEEWGIDGLLRRIEGDYAVALWDAPREKLFLFRDRAGVKPLYFSLQREMLLFGSEIKAILEHPAVERDVDPVAMYHYLSFLTTPAPMTMFRGIYKLPVGYCMEVSTDGSLRTWRYWSAVPQERQSDVPSAGAPREEYYVREIRSRLEKSVEKRMMSDVPFGAFLSGGIDSSAIVALMAAQMDRPVDTFSVGFSDHTHLNELDYAERVAKRFKTNHHVVQIDEYDMRGYLDELVYHQDEPIADWVCIPLHFVSRLARDSGVTVVQVGEGADEQFCGYSGYMAYLRLYEKYWRPFRSFTPRSVQRLLASSAARLSAHSPRYEVYADIVDRAAHDRDHFWTGAVAFWELTKRRLLYRDSFRPVPVPPALEATGLLPPPFQQPDSFRVIDTFNAAMQGGSLADDVLAGMTYKEFQLRLPELLLMRVDKITMASSLEARVPFLDHNLLEFTLNIPMREKIPGGVTKYLLKQAVRGLIPDEIIDRPKRGFGAPMVQWMSGDFGRHAQATVMSSRLLQRGFFNPTEVKRLFDDHFAGRRDNTLYIWTLFNLTAWYDYWIEGSSSGSRQVVAA